MKRSGLTGSGKKARRRDLRSLRSQALAALDAKARKEKAEIEGAYTFTWIGFLEARALAGDMPALGALRRSKNQSAKIAADFLSAADPLLARTILLKDANPQIRAGGQVHYKTADGGALTDEAARVRVDKTSYQAAFLALSLAAERFSGQALLIEGTEAFKHQATRSPPPAQPFPYLRRSRPRSRAARTDPRARRRTTALARLFPVHIRAKHYGSYTIAGLILSRLLAQGMRARRSTMA